MPGARTSALYEMTPLGGGDTLAGMQSGEMLAGRYQLIEKVARGGMGEVWRGTQVALGREVAIKLIRGGQRGDESDWPERFQREARLAASIHHRNVVDIIDYGAAADGTQFLVMPFLAGRSLDRRLARQLRPSLTEILDWIHGVLSGLAAVHAQGIIHRDLKPGNVFLAEDGDGVVPKLLDFGISRFAGDQLPGPHLTGTGVSMGTAGYMAPEQFESAHDVDHRADLYSVGVLLYEALSGRLPFVGQDAFAIHREVLAGEAAPLESLRPDLPLALCQLIHRALSRDPASRFDSAQAMRDTLQVVGELGAPQRSRGPAAGPPAFGMSPPQRSRGPAAGPPAFGVSPPQPARRPAAGPPAFDAPQLEPFGQPAVSGPEQPNVPAAGTQPTAPAQLLPPQAAPLQPPVAQPESTFGQAPRSTSPRALLGGLAVIAVIAVAAGAGALLSGSPDAPMAAGAAPVAGGSVAASATPTSTVVVRPASTAALPPVIAAPFRPSPNPPVALPAALPAASPEQLQEATDAAVTAYRGSLAAHDRRQPERYFGSYAGTMECFMGERDFPLASLRELRSYEVRSDAPAPRAGGSGMWSTERRVLSSSLDRVVLLDWGVWHSDTDIPRASGGVYEKLIVMKSDGSGWRIAVETDRERAACVRQDWFAQATPPQTWAGCAGHQATCASACQTTCDACQGACIECRSCTNRCLCQLARCFGNRHSSFCE